MIRSSITECWGKCDFSFLRNCHTDFYSGCTRVHSKERMHAPFTIFASMSFHWLLYDKISKQFLFSFWWLRMMHIYLHVPQSLEVTLLKILCLYIYIVFKLDCLFPWCPVFEFFIYFGYRTSIRYVIGKNLFQFSGLLLVSWWCPLLHKIFLVSWDLREDRSSVPRAQQVAHKCL